MAPPNSPPRPASLWLYALHLWTIFGIALSNLFFGLTALALPSALKTRPVGWKRSQLLLLPLALYAGSYLLSIALSHDPSGSWRAGRAVLLLATTLFAVVIVREERQVRWIVDGLIVVSSLAAIVGLVQGWFLGYGGIDKRIVGPFSHYMTFAGVLLLADLLLLAQMVTGKHRKPWRWVALVAINAALLQSLTRSAWVAFALTLTAYVLLRAPRWILAYIPAALLFGVLAPENVARRATSIFDLQDTSNYDRVCMAEAGLLMVREKPLFGIGPRMVRERYPLYRHPSAPREWVPHLHNNVVHIAAEEGLVGLTAFLWLMLGSMWKAFEGFRVAERSGKRDLDLYLGALLALIGFNLAGLFEYSWGDTEVQRIVLFLLAVPYCLREEETLE